MDRYSLAQYKTIIPMECPNNNRSKNVCVVQVQYVFPGDHTNHKNPTSVFCF